MFVPTNSLFGRFEPKFRFAFCCRFVLSTGFKRYGTQLAMEEGCSSSSTQYFNTRQLNVLSHIDVIVPV